MGAIEAARAAEDATAGVGARGRVLFVDDEPDIALSFADALRAFVGADLEVATVPDAAAARALLARERFDVVISDERLPGERGRELLAWVREAHPGTLRVLTTAAYQARPPEEVAREAGVDLFLPKPMHAHDCFVPLRRLLEQRWAKAP